MTIKVGSDEFCTHCMERREYDEEGRCKICKHVIHRENKKQPNHAGYDSYKLESPQFEIDEDTVYSEY